MGMTLKLRVWRQAGPGHPGRLVDYTATNIHPDMSFLEMLDVVNEHLILAGEDPVAFDSDCREGICGSCGLMINGLAHGPDRGATTCQVHMRRFRDGETIVVEPFRARAFPVLKDLVVDRGALDRIVAAGGYVSINVGGAPDGNAIPIPKPIADRAMDSAQCIQCGACVAQCKNAASHLFTAAKIAHLGLLPQGVPEADRRVVRMVRQMDAEGFGSCSNEGECEAVCPKEIPMTNIARMNRHYLKLTLAGR